jgi:hypothetical protein
MENEKIGPITSRLINQEDIIIDDVIEIPSGEYEPNIQARIILRSKEPFDGHPEVFTIGSFSAMNNDREFGYDWDTVGSNSSTDEHGYLIIEAGLSDFSEDFDEANIAAGIELNEITAQFITESTLVEMFYECYSDKDETNFIMMELVSFTVIADSIDDEVEYRFTDEQIEQFNQQVENEFNADSSEWNEFAEKADPVAPDPENNPTYFLWDDFDAAALHGKTHPEQFLYTMGEADGVQYVQEGGHFVNRLAYIFTRNHVPFNGGSIKY